MSLEQAKRTKFEVLSDFSFVDILSMLAGNKYSLDTLAEAADWYRQESSDQTASFKALVLESLWFICTEHELTQGSGDVLKTTVFRELPKYIK